jgi:diguanylate cyclase (GGDEF)-like protein
MPDRAFHAAESETGLSAPLVVSRPDTCRECWTCARLCPAKAIRIPDGRPEIVAERCVSCGMCVMECSSECFLIRNDAEAVRELLGGPRPVVAILATEFITAMHPLSPTELEVGLEAIGFHAVETTLLGEEIVASRYETLCARANGLPLLRSTCPVIVEWVKRYRPALTKALAPVVPPYIAQARLVKTVYPDDVAVVYAGPCFARKDEARQPQFAGIVDVAIDFLELAALLEEGEPVTLDAASGANRPKPLKEISLTDGFPRAPLEARTMTATDVNVSRGLFDVDKVLQAILAGETAPDIVDLLNCEGCIDGPAVSPGMSVFAKRNIEIAERENRGGNRVSSRELLKYLPEVELARSFAPTPVEEGEPTEEQVDRALADVGFDTHEDVLDCRACGYATCKDLATAVLRGTASWELCFPLQRRRLREDIESLATSATIAPVTGLWNRTALSDRLTDEVARFERYGTPVSLLMLDLDTFKRVNDEWGHLVGDQLLAAVGHVLGEDRRASDFAARYGGDEFAVVLPGTNKTEAYAVAEKVRKAIGALRIVPREVDGEASIGTSVSIGVASAGQDAVDGVGLLDAADRALYAAKEGGRDQVRLASQ